MTNLFRLGIHTIVQFKFGSWLGQDAVKVLLAPQWFEVLACIYNPSCSMFVDNNSQTSFKSSCFMTGKGYQRISSNDPLYTSPLLLELTSARGT